MKMIFCKYLNKISEAHDFQFYPGEIGKKIYKHISKLAWKIWISEQTKFINENKLNMTNIQDYNKIEKHMINFLFKKNKLL